MDSVAEIKSRLPIEQLVGQYAQLTKKGRNFVCLCPFHNDTKPSLLVSPDKGIAYCFACNSGGDIFSFYQKIEGVDFVQALKDLAEKAGVTLPDRPQPTGPKKDEKERARACLESAQAFYQQQLKTSELAQGYVKKRGVPEEQIEMFGLGLAPDSFTATYDHLLKAGFSRNEIVSAGLAVQKDIEGKYYDRFRNRLMFPIHDIAGKIIGFGGRTLGNDDAKYINSTDGILYHKSNVLYGFHHAKEAMRESESAIIVEGYFDVLACHRVGVTNVVAASGTAFTQEHAKLLKRSCTNVSLCLDQDAAGIEAAERAFGVLSAEDLHVRAIRLPEKDPGDLVQSDPDLLKENLKSAQSYIELVIQDITTSAPESPFERKQVFERLARLLALIPNRIERAHYIEKAQILSPLGLRGGDLEQMIQSAQTSRAIPSAVASSSSVPKTESSQIFSAAEITLGIVLLFPKLQNLLDELMVTDDAFVTALRNAIRALGPRDILAVTDLALEGEHLVRAQILQLYCEQHGFTDWSESMATREARRNCQAANRELLKRKQKEITTKLVSARAGGRKDEETVLSREYEQVLQMLLASSH